MKHVHWFQNLIWKEMLTPIVIVDATLGNGHDTLALKKMYPEAKIISIDIQSEAVNTTRARLSDENIEDVQLLHASHEHMNQLIDQEIDMVVYNLGYLPGSDKKIATKSSTTIASLKSVLPLMNKGGKIFLTAYPGTIQGRVEAISVESFLSGLSQRLFDVAHIQMINQQKNPPELFIVSKK
jgi:tRNA1(Val) A37 N6-methylase TrmN6